MPPLAPRDPLITTLGLDQAWPLSTGTGVTVGVVDSGVNPASPKLAGAVDRGKTLRVDNTPKVFTTVDGGQVDCNGHGTAIAGIIAGRTAKGDNRVSGVAPTSRIYPVAVQGDIGQAPATLIAAAIRLAAQHARVINLSFAQTTDNKEIRAAVQYALRRDVVVVAAAANESAPASSGSAVWYPAAYPGVLAVTAVAADGSPDPQAARGNYIGLAAPGEALTTVPPGGKGYVTVTGTSFATAIVSGTAALLRSRFPKLDATAVVQRLEHTAVPPGDGGRDDQIGFGVVDPFAALTLTTPRRPDVRPSAGRIGVHDISAGPPPRSNAGVLGATAILASLAVLVGLATLSVRAGRRRGWHAGTRPTARVQERRAEAHSAELD